MANEADDQVENYTGQWFLGSLIGWTGWPELNGKSLRTMLFDAFHGEGPIPKLWDHNDSFTNTLRAAAGSSVPGFDPAMDE